MKIFKNTPTNKYKNSLAGFTLIETLVAVTLFTFVSLVALIVLSTTQILNTRLTSTRIVYDNINLILDDISREMRQGNGYQLVNTGAHGSSGNGVKFNAFSGGVDTITYEYFFNSDEGVIKKYTTVNSGSPTVEDINSKQIKITSLVVNLDGNNPFPSVDGTPPFDIQQPLANIIISGQTVDAPIIPFKIESAISQRDNEQ
jgi:type II secretory pathway pseudopilin PulG